jgi:hypothetical protein
MKLSLLGLAMAFFCHGQVLNLTAPLCSPSGPAGTGPKLQAVIPITVSGITIPVPACLSLGAGLKLTGTTLDVTVTAVPAAVPRAMVETVQLDSTMLSAPTLTRTMLKKPAPDTVLIAWARTSTVGMQALDAVANPGTTITITLPVHRPFTAADQILLIYWTLEP